MLFSVTIEFSESPFRAESRWPAGACTVTVLVRAESVSEAIISLHLGRDVRHISATEIYMTIDIPELET